MRWCILAAVLAGAACGHKKASIEGRVDYMDSRWDPSGPPVPALGILVHVMPGGEPERREILFSYLAVLASMDPAAPDPSLVEHVISSHAPTDAIIEAAETDAQGRYSLDGLRAGDLIVFAEYTSDLGHFAWMEYVRVQGTRTAVVDLTYANRLAVRKPRPMKTFTKEPPPYEAVRSPELLEKYLVPKSP
ncbi:MAG: hypothetical protein JRG91_02905 [Deltaproteobacteria bacterium]|nr:hypothetical protein [Deltaproteobacteria bacterium]